MLIWQSVRMIKALRAYQYGKITHDELQKVFDEIKLKKEVYSAIKRQTQKHSHKSN